MIGSIDVSLMNEFDPYHELIVVKHNTTVLINQYNRHDEILRELTEQHHKLTSLLRAHRIQLDELRKDINILIKKLEQDK